MDVVGLRLTRAVPHSDTSAVAAHPGYHIANNDVDATSKNRRPPTLSNLPGRSSRLTMRLASLRYGVDGNGTPSDRFGHGYAEAFDR